MKLPKILSRNRKDEMFQEETRRTALRGVLSEAAFEEEELKRRMGADFYMIRSQTLEKQFNELKELNKTNEAMLYNLMALQAMCDNICATSWVDKDYAKLMFIKVRKTLLRVEMSMPETLYSLGFSNLLEQYGNIAALRLQDSINGRKAQLLKKTVREIKVGQEK